MNAVAEFALLLKRRQIVNLLSQGPVHKSLLAAETEELRERAVRRHRQSLAVFLNRLRRGDLEELCEGRRMDKKGTVGELRARLWLAGARLEGGGEEHLGRAYQPIPIVLGSFLVYQGPLHGTCPEAAEWPRAIPEPVPSPCVDGEPETLEELLRNADALLGLRMGGRGADKGIYGTRIAELLGVKERGLAEADWRGEVEIKTVPVVRDRAGWWRVKEDPAISMEQVDPRRKLRKVLWIARVGEGKDSPILSWYYQEWDAKVRDLAHRHLHQRPKGPKGTQQKGWYMHKRFFLYNGFLKSLNG